MIFWFAQLLCSNNFTRNVSVIKSLLSWRWSPGHCDSTRQIFQKVCDSCLELIRVIHVGQVRRVFDPDHPGRRQFLDHILRGSQDVRGIMFANDDQNGSLEVAETVKCRDLCIRQSFAKLFYLMGKGL